MPRWRAFMRRSPILVLDEASLLHYGEMSRNGGVIDAGHVDELANTPFAPAELLGYEEARRVPQGLQNLRFCFKIRLSFLVHGDSPS